MVMWHAIVHVDDQGKHWLHWRLGSLQQLLDGGLLSIVEYHYPDVWNRRPPLHIVLLLCSSALSSDLKPSAAQNIHLQMLQGL